MMTFRSAIAATALAAMIPLAACSKAEGDAATTAESADRTLAATIADAPGLGNVSSALSDAGLAGIFDGPGSYTVLAPSDDAFAKLGDGEQELTSDDERPIMVAVLRDHILPGHLTPDEIREAVKTKGGPVEMRTLGEGTVKFSIDGDAIAISGEDGLKAKIAGDDLAASNGVVIPIDGLLKKPQPIT